MLLRWSQVEVWRRISDLTGRIDDRKLTSQNNTLCGWKNTLFPPYSRQKYRSSPDNPSISLICLILPQSSTHFLSKGNLFKTHFHLPKILINFEQYIHENDSILNINTFYNYFLLHPKWLLLCVYFKLCLCHHVLVVLVTYICYIP